MQQSIYLLFFKNSYFTSDLNIILTDKDKADSSNYKKGIYLSLFSGLSLLLVFYLSKEKMSLRTLAGSARLFFT